MEVEEEGNAYRGGGGVGWLVVVVMVEVWFGDTGGVKIR